MVEDIAPRKAHNCNGSLEEFSFTFPLIVSSDLAVYLKNTSTNAVTLLTETTDYVVKDPDGAEGVLADFENGGSITTTVETPYSNVYQIILERSVPYTQESDFTEGMPSLYQTFEDALDKLTMEVQQLKDLIGRSPYCPADDPTTLDMEMPSAVTRAGKLFGFDDNGEPVAVTEIEGVTVTDFGNALLSANDAEDGREVLGLENVENVEQMPLSYLDTDTALTADSDAKVASQKATKSYVDTLIGSIPSGGSIRQTVLSGAIDSSGYANFISAGSGLSVDIAATTTPIRIAFADGFDSDGAVDYVGSIDADTSITSLTASATNYLYAERNTGTGAISLGFTNHLPIYAFGAGSYASYNPRSLGTNVGDMTANGGLAAAFDGNETQATAACAAKAVAINTEAYVGKDWGAGVQRAVTACTVISSSDYGFFNNSSGTTTLTLYGSNDNSNWDSLGSATQAQSYAKLTKALSMSDTTTQYRYHRVGIKQDSGSWSVIIGEVVFTVEVPYIYSVPDMSWADSTCSGREIVFIGEAITDGSSVTSVVNYALRGKYDSGDITTTASSTNKNHNIGVDYVKATLLEGSAGARTQIMSKDFTSITRNSITWSAVAGTSRLIVERGF